MPSKPAEKAEAEAVEPATSTFTWTGESGQTITFAIPGRIKRGRVARRLSYNDVLGAMDVIFTEEEVAAFEDLELSPAEWGDLQEQLWDAVTGTDPKP